jgi:hypothetical protein
MEVLIIFACFFSLLPWLCAVQKERLWQEFFSDPSQWWDHRLEKVNE